MSMGELKTNEASVIDADGGFLCLTTRLHNDSNPDAIIGARKLVRLVYIPVEPEEDCLCGSGRTYGDCCRQQPVWRSICLDPGGKTYGFVAPRSATYHHVDSVAIRERLMADPRFLCVDDKPRCGFWIYLGRPAVGDEEGIHCFGDVELERDHTLTVSAMSDPRMDALNRILESLFGDSLGTPQIRQQPLPSLVKDRRRHAVRLRDHP